MALIVPTRSGTRDHVSEGRQTDNVASCIAFSAASASACSPRWSEISQSIGAPDQPAREGHFSCRSSMTKAWS